MIGPLDHRTIGPLILQKNRLMDKKIEKLIIFQLPFIIRRMPWNNWGRGSWTTSFGRRLEPRHQQDLLICFGGGFYR